MDPTTQAADRALEAFRASRSLEGRFLSYCRGRSRHFWSRQLLAAACAPIFLTFVDWRICLFCALVAFAGEALDCGLLHRIGKRTALGDRLPLAIGATTVTGGIQALTVCLLIAVAHSYGGEPARTFAGAICLAAILDAALLYGVHRGAALVRLLIYVVALGTIVMQEIQTHPDKFAQVFFDVASIALLAYMIWAMVRHVHKTRQRKAAIQMDTLQSARALAHANEALRDSRQMTRRLAMVAERANDAVIITEDDGTITWVNHAFTRSTGYAYAEAVGRNVQFLNCGETDEEVSAQLDRARAQHLPFRAELINRRNDGSRGWVEVNMAPVFDENGGFLNMISIERDIDEAKRREHALAEARRTAEEAVRARHNFLATMSHEIRTPMNGVIGTADLLLDTELDETQRGLVRTITSSGEALLAIVNDILDFTKLEEGRLEVAREPFELAGVIRNAVDLITPLAESKGLDVSLAMPGDLPSLLVGDAGRLRQVLLNLLGNAVKFTESGHVGLDLGARQIGELCHLRIAVTDTGVGIAPDRLDGIFDRFSQVDPAMAGRFGGTGLGLAISRLLLRAMGGEVTVSSRPGRGSEFVISLPLPLAENPGAAKPVAALEEAASGGALFSGYKVLVAEDNRTNTLLIDRMLSPLGLDLVFAVNGREAIDLYRAHQPDLVLMDMRMPIVDGPAATREIRTAEAATTGQPVPILALTANAFAEDRQICLDSGMNAVLTKPFRKRDLIAALHEYLPGAGAAPAAPACVPGRQAG